MGLTNNLGKLSNMITSTGSAVGIAQSSPSYTLDVTGTGRFTGTVITGSGSGNTLSSGSIDVGKDVGLAATQGIVVNNARVLAFASTGAATFSSSVTAASYLGVLKDGSDTIGAGAYLVLAATTSSRQWIQQLSASQNLTFYHYTGSAWIQPVTFTSGGNVGIGTSSPSSKLSIVKGTSDGAIANFTGASGEEIAFGINSTENYIYTTANGKGLTFYVDDTERMRIGSSGGVSIINLGVTTGGMNVSSPNSYNSVAYNSACLSTASTSFYHFVGQSGNGSSITTNNILIYGNGNVQNANNSYGAISDIKLKENIVDASPKLDDLLKVKIRNYNLIGDETKQIGVIAQELEEIFPSMIDEDKEGTKGVKYSVFVPMLIKAIQEQQAQIEELKLKIK